MKHPVAALLGLVAAAACVPPAAPEGQVHPIVNGTDNRREYFEVDADTQARMAESMVALIPKSALTERPDGVTVNAPSWREVANLCPDEPFGDQPAAAFCSGILVDWDLVLTSGHCTRVLAPASFAVVFGYHYLEPGKLAVGRGDLFDVAQIVSERLSQSGARPRIDFAWLRLHRPVKPPRAPAPIRTTTTVTAGAPLLFVGAGGAVPLKADRGGLVTATGEPWFDYFTASTDSFRGASGGGAFDGELALLGALERGGPDLMMAGAGCLGSYQEADGAAREEFTFAGRALEGLCAQGNELSSLCRPDCGDPCRALPPPEIRAPADSGCTLGATSPGGTNRWLWLAVLSFVLARSARRRGPLTSLLAGPRASIRTAGDNPGSGRRSPWRRRP